jgi:hypothetical protein
MPNPQKVIEILNRLDFDVKKISKYSIKQESTYFSLLRAALLKNFEFNIFIWKADKKHSFFNTATLRGICEDIIALNFIGNFAEKNRNELVEKLFLLNILESCETQANFFKVNKSYQPVLNLNQTNKNTTPAQLKEDIKAIVKKQHPGLQIKSNGLPSIYKMSEDCGLKELYDYLYAATSRWVHFSPHILIRMGWDEPEDDLGSFCKVSTENFSQYYLDFTRFYATYLFTKFCDVFQEKLDLSKDFIELVEQLIGLIDDTARWPEIVTFEEMNRKPPSYQTYALFQVVNSMKDKEREDQ